MFHSIPDVPVDGGAALPPSAKKASSNSSSTTLLMTPSFLDGSAAYESSFDRDGVPADMLAYLPTHGWDTPPDSPAHVQQDFGGFADPIASAAAPDLSPGLSLFSAVKGAGEGAASGAGDASFEWTPPASPLPSDCEDFSSSIGSYLPLSAADDLGDACADLDSPFADEYGLGTSSMFEDSLGYTSADHAADLDGYNYTPYTTDNEDDDEGRGSDGDEAGGKGGKGKGKAAANTDAPGATAGPGKRKNGTEHKARKRTRQKLEQERKKRTAECDKAVKALSTAKVAANPESRRNTHNVMERKRRNDLKNSYEELRELIPALADNVRAPTGQILTHAVDAVHQLQRDAANFAVSLPAANAENARLRALLGAAAVAQALAAAAAVAAAAAAVASAAATATATAPATATATATA